MSLKILSKFIIEKVGERQKTEIAGTFLGQTLPAPAPPPSIVTESDIKGPMTTHY